MVLLALAIRLVAIAFLYPEQLDPGRDHWKFGYENGRIARSIAEGRGFGSPLFEETGATAWMTPVYPYFIAGVFKLFGVYTKASALVLLSLQALISALTCLPIFWFARKLFGLRVALWSGWAWAFFPYAIYFPAERIWPTWLSALLLCLLLLMTLHLERSRRTLAWIGFGLLWGFAALNEPIVLSAWPFMAAWICWRRYRQRLRWAVPMAVSVLALVVSVAPWFARNYVVFGRFIPFRDTLGLELYVGNTGDGSYWHPRWAGPWHNEQDWQAFKELGEIGYMERQKERGLEFIRAHPRWFAVTTLRRFAYLWTGYWSFDRKYLEQEPLDPPNVLFSSLLTLLALYALVRAWRSNRPVALLFAAVLFFSPFLYYLTHVEVYYRRQIDPLVVILAVSALIGDTKRFHEPVVEIEGGPDYGRLARDWRGHGAPVRRSGREGAVQLPDGEVAGR